MAEIHCTELFFAAKRCALLENSILIGKIRNRDHRFGTCGAKFGGDRFDESFCF